TIQGHQRFANAQCSSLIPFGKCVQCPSPSCLKWFIRFGRRQVTRKSITFRDVLREHNGLAHHRFDEIPPLGDATAAFGHRSWRRQRKGPTGASLLFALRRAAVRCISTTRTSGNSNFPGHLVVLATERIDPLMPLTGAAYFSTTTSSCGSAVFAGIALRAA